MTSPTLGRVNPPLVADEHAMLAAWLDFHRATLELKCAGVSEDAPPLYYSDEDPDGDFDNVADADVEEASGSTAPRGSSGSRHEQPRLGPTAR